MGEHLSHLSLLLYRFGVRNQRLLWVPAGRAADPRFSGGSPTMTSRFRVYGEDERWDGGLDARLITSFCDKTTVVCPTLVTFTLNATPA